MIVISIATPAPEHKLRRDPAQGTRSPGIEDDTGRPWVDGELAHAWLEANLSVIDANTFFAPASNSACSPKSSVEAP
jgi:hypothetical protein